MTLAETDLINRALRLNHVRLLVGGIHPDYHLDRHIDHTGAFAQSPFFKPLPSLHIQHIPNGHHPMFGGLKRWDAEAGIFARS
jgi:hypothetical protein